MVKLIRYAWFVLVFNVGVIMFGAFVRATGSGAGCGPSWPTCRAAPSPAVETERTIEFTHRMTAGAALIMVAVLVFLVWRATTKGHLARIGVGLAAAAIVGEALIGAMIVLAEWVAENTSVARVISVPLHLVNTFFLLAGLTLTIFWLRGGRRLDFRSNPAIIRAVVIGGVALVLIAATGAVTALADTLFPKYGVADLAAEEHFLTNLRIIHPILAAVVVGIGWWVASRSEERGRGKAAVALPILVGLMIVTGMLNIALHVPLWSQMVHLGLADALWVTYVFVSADALQVPSVTASRLSPSR